MLERIKQLFFKDNHVKPKSLKRILAIIEDDPKFITFFNRALKRANCDLLTAIDKVSGLQMADRHQPDIIILNAYINGEKCIDLCIQLKGNEATKHIPLLVIAEKDDHSNMVEYYEQVAGMGGYLTRPISRRQLIQEIDMIINDSKDRKC